MRDGAASWSPSSIDASRVCACRCEVATRQHRHCRGRRHDFADSALIYNSSRNLSSPGVAFTICGKGFAFSRHGAQICRETLRWSTSCFMMSLRKTDTEVETDRSVFSNSKGMHISRNASTSGGDRSHSVRAQLRGMLRLDDERCRGRA